MTSDISTMEAFAHAIRGGTTVFFLFWAVILKRYKSRNRMMWLLYFASLLIGICYIKDSVFLINEWKLSEYLNALVGIIDMLYIPVASAYFLEVAKPGVVTNKQIYVAMAVQSVFIPAYTIWPTEAVRLAASFVAYIISIATVIYITIFVTRYRRQMFSTYSYTDNIDIKWVLIACYAFFTSHILYTLSFDSTTWLSETLFNVSNMILWFIIAKMARRHKVLRMLAARNEEETVEAEEAEAGEIEAGEVSPDNNVDMSQVIKQRRESIIERKLPIIMQEKKFYLNPKLSIIDLAMEIGTNKTYLSDYLKNNLLTNFYDFVNKYRVEEACRIMKSMPSKDRKRMTEVATMSGFNSISSFNRYFIKIMGVSPSRYYMEHANSETTE